MADTTATTHEFNAIIDGKEVTGVTGYITLDNYGHKSNLAYAYIPGFTEETPAGEFPAIIFNAPDDEQDYAMQDYPDDFDFTAELGNAKNLANFLEGKFFGDANVKAVWSEGVTVAELSDFDLISHVLPQRWVANGFGDDFEAYDLPLLELVYNAMLDGNAQVQSAIALANMNVD